MHLKSRRKASWINQNRCTRCSGALQRGLWTLLAAVLLLPQADCTAFRRRRRLPRERQMYDTSVGSFSPDGSIHQVEYAAEAVAKGSLAIGVAAEDGVVLAAHVRRQSPLLKLSSVPKISAVDRHVVCAVAGLLPDGRLLVDQAREHAVSHWFQFDEPVSVLSIASHLSRIAAKFHRYSTGTGGNDRNGKGNGNGDSDDSEEDSDDEAAVDFARPLGAAVLLAGIDIDGGDAGGSYTRGSSSDSSSYGGSNGDGAGGSSEGGSDGVGANAGSSSGEYSNGGGGFWGTPVLFHVDPSGARLRWRAKAVGTGAAAVESRLEEAEFIGMRTRQAMGLALRAMKKSLAEDFDVSRVEMVVVSCGKDGYSYGGGGGGRSSAAVGGIGYSESGGICGNDACAGGGATATEGGLAPISSGTACEVLESPVQSSDAGGGPRDPQTAAEKANDAAVEELPATEAAAMAAVPVGTVGTAGAEALRLTFLRPEPPPLHRRVSVEEMEAVLAEAEAAAEPQGPTGAKANDPHTAIPA
ncbi:unnamed protein product [Phaeothamnion confervicola]